MTKEESKKPLKPKGQGRTRAAHKKVFDVVPPGKSVAPPNSRSVIVGHKPPVQDDQFVGDPSEKRPLIDGHKKLDLKPASPAEEAGGNATTAPELHSSTPSAAVVPESSASTGEVMAAHEAHTNDVASPPGTDTTSQSQGPAEVHGAPELQRGEGAPIVDASASEHLADLAVEQTVETETFDTPDKPGATSGSSEGAPVLDQPVSSVSPESTTDGNLNQTGGTAPARPATVDDLLADTGPPTIAPHPQQAVVSHHHRRGGALRAVMNILFVLILAAAAFNLLLDAEIIKTSLDLPYTDLIR